jgi:predicted dehydrogenase
LFRNSKKAVTAALENGAWQPEDGVSMNRRKLRIGVIGGGHLGTIHTRLVRSIDDVELVGVADPCPQTRQRLSDEFGVTTFEDHRALAERVDAAIVAAPTEHHYWIGMELAEAGVHLLVEKPITQTVAEADALIRAATSRNLVLQVGHVERFNPAFSAAAAEVGSPWYIEAVRASGYTCRSVDVGVVHDLMIHDIDLVLSLVRSEVVDIAATGTAVVGPHEDIAHAHLRFANGCLASINASRTSFQPQRSMQVFGSDVYAGIDFAAGTTKLIRPSEPVRRGQIDVRQMTADQRRTLQEQFFTDILPLREVQVEKRNAILDEQYDFVISIRSGQSPQVSGVQGRDALAVAEQIVQRIAAQRTAMRKLSLLEARRWKPSETPSTLPRRRAG